MPRLKFLLPYIILLAYTLLVVQPLWREQMLCNDDGFYHINKALVLEEVLLAGHFPARWMPQMAWGYGYPHFNYYAPLASFGLIGLHQLGLTYPLAFHFLLSVCVWLAGVGTFRFVREWWGEAAGLVAGVAYLTAPYFAFDIVIRGALAETVALIWPPWIFFFLHRALHAGPRSWFSLAAILSFAALLFTHNTSALAVAPFAGMYVVFLSFFHSLKEKWEIKERLGKLLHGGALLGLGLALATGFWLPALVERNLVQSDRLLVPPIFTYYTNFLAPWELLAWPRFEDPLLVNPSPEKGLGALAVSLAALGFVASIVHRRQASVSVFFLSFLTAFALLTLPLSRFVWDSVPLIEFIQFPWRLLGPGAFCAAVLAGGCVNIWPKRSVWIAGGLMLALAYGHLGWWYARYCGPIEEITLAQTVAYERATGTIGTTAKGEFLPTTVRVFPDDASIADALIRGEQPVYLSGLPQNTPLVIENADVLSYRATLTLTAPAQLVFKQFYYPGWQATLNGQPVSITPTADFGFISASIPAGVNTIAFSFGSTPLRTAGELVSWATVLILLAASVWIAKGKQSPSGALAQEPLNARAGLLLFLCGVALAGARPLFIERVANPVYHTVFDGERVSAAQNQLRLNFQGGLQLYGFDVDTRAIPGNPAVDAALYVALPEPALRHFWPVMYLRDGAGRDWTHPQAFIPPRWHKEPPPTYLWPAGSYAQWARRVGPAPGTPPGGYELWFEVIDRENGANQSIVDENGNALQPQWSLGAISVGRPTEPFALEPLTRTETYFGPLTLLGFDALPAHVNAGDSFNLSWYWRSEGATNQDLLAQVQWVNANNEVAAQVELEPANNYATSLWQAGDEWRGQHMLTTPAALPSGTYTLRVAVTGQSGTQTLGALVVSAPERTFTPPPFEQTSGAQFSGVGELAGYTLIRTAENLQLTLVWKATATPAQRYSVFV
ncbi:MAG: hypothetical protein JNL09_06285, partial [Anaerolineales bacterium]|nr:hypothetical protein [Anaerolineales bacterium]